MKSGFAASEVCRALKRPMSLQVRTHVDRVMIKCRCSTHTLFLNGGTEYAERLGPRRCAMPKHLSARPPQDATEERKVRKLAHSVHAPADWIFHAQIVAHSWDGLRTRQIAEVLGCHPQTVRERLQAFNERGFEGLGMKPGGGRKPRLTEQ